MGCCISEKKVIITTVNNSYKNKKLPNKINDENIIGFDEINKNRSYNDEENKIYKDNEIKKIKKIKKINYIKKIREFDWERVLNYLNFKEVTEAGRVNKFFQTLLRKGRVLKKFFENKKIQKTYILVKKPKASKNKVLHFQTIASQSQLIQTSSENSIVKFNFANNFDKSDFYA